MKVMIVAGSYYNESLKQFKKNKTGLGIIINEIMNYSTKVNEVYFLSKVLTKKNSVKTEFGQYHILSHNIMRILISFRFIDFKEAYNLIKKSNIPLIVKLKYLYYIIDKGFIIRALSKIRPDIVHIHGISYATQTYIDACIETGTPYVLTLHGVIGNNNTSKIFSVEKKLEEKILKKLEKNNQSITVVSSGSKNTLKELYNLNGFNIEVVLNGTATRYNPDSCDEDFYNKYNSYISSGKKIVTVIGNIYSNKNQIQIVEAWKMMNEELKKNVIFFFMGNILDDGVIEEAIASLNASENLITCGFISKINMSFLLNYADLNVVASISEGFGLSVIEAFTFGVPTVIFKDLDAVEDLYDENVMLTVSLRDTKELSQKIEQALKKNWNKDYIIKYASNFSLDVMSENYQKVYEKVVKKYDK